MGWFGKKKYAKNFTRDDEFMKSYAIKINGLTRYAEGNDRLTEALVKLKEDFQYTIGSAAKPAKKNEANIDKMYNSLKEAFQKPELDEAGILLIIRNMGMEIDEINAQK